MRTGQSLSEVSFVSLSSPHGHLSCCGSQLIRAVGLNLVSGNSQSRSKDAADERKRAASRSECVLATQMFLAFFFHLFRAPRGSIMRLQQERSNTQML